MIYREDHFFTAGECVRLRAAMDAGTPEPAEIIGHAMELEVETRRTTLVDVHPRVLLEVEQRLDDCRTRLETFFSVTLTRREGVSFLRYFVGGFYLPHRDRAEVSGWPDAAARRVAVVVFLNDAVSGGALHFPESTVRVSPTQGALIGFPADVLHEVEPVLAGPRDVIVDWFY